MQCSGGGYGDGTTAKPQYTEAKELGDGLGWLCGTNLHLASATHCMANTIIQCRNYWTGCMPRDCLTHLISGLFIKVYNSRHWIIICLHLSYLWVTVWWCHMNASLLYIMLDASYKNLSCETIYIYIYIIYATTHTMLLLMYHSNTVNQY